MSQSSTFTIVTPSEVCQHSSNLTKMIKDKSGKVFRWHQDKLHTTLDGTTPVKYSLGDVSPSFSNNYSKGQFKPQEPIRSPSVSSSSSSSSSNPNYSHQQLYSPRISTSPASSTFQQPSNKITKPYKARDSFKFFDYTMKKRKRTKRCDQVQPYENVISFTMTTNGHTLNSSSTIVNSSNSSLEKLSIHSSVSVSSNSSSGSSSSASDERMESTLDQISQFMNYPTSQQTLESVSTAPLVEQPKRFVRTSISIKELLN